MNILTKCLSIVLSFLAVTTSAQTKTLSRLVATSGYGFDGAGFKMSDTSTIFWSASRGGDLVSPMLYDSSLSFLARSASTLDSNTRNRKTYNSANKVLTHKREFWANATLGWMNSIYSYYTYDANNNEIEELTKKWDFVTLTWENQDSILKTYDASSNLITHTYIDWIKSTKKWENKNQYIYTYDAKNLKTNSVTRLWDGIKWVNNIQSTYTFDTKDNLVSTIDFNWNSGSSNWDSVRKIETSYSSTNKRLKETNYNYKAGGWIPQRITEFAYNASDSVSEIYYMDWNATISSWSNMSKANYSYNSFGKLMLLKVQNGLNDTGWQNFYQRDYDYNLTKNSTIRVTSSWNKITSKYDSNSKVEWVYNTYNQLTQQVLEYWDGALSVFISDNITNYYYEEFTAGIKDARSPIGSLAAYPIPATQLLNLEINWQERQNFSVTIYDAVGRAVSNWTLKNEQHYKEHFSLDNYANGQFFIVVVTDKGDKISKSFIVQK